MDHNRNEPEAASSAVTSENEANRDNIASRRRFLKGTTIALPAVMTLNPVAARATARVSSLACTNDVPQYGHHCIVVDTNPGDCYRDPVDCFDKLEWKRGRWTRTNIASYFLGTDSENTLQTPKVCWRRMDGSIVDPIANADELTKINSPLNSKRVSTGVSDTKVKNGFATVHWCATTGRKMAVGKPTPPSGCIIASVSMACLNSITG